MSRRARPAVTRRRLGRALGGHLPQAGQTVGLLGGSFNPPHDGHLEISRVALKRLELDELWWLVSPQNPLKPSQGTPPLAQRLAAARAMVRHPRLRVTGVEALLGTTFTARTLEHLDVLFPGVRFVWLMGADNLVQITDWQDWQQIFRTANVAVFDRPSYSLKALASKAAHSFSAWRLPERRARELARQDPPAWVFIHNRLNPRSSTELRRAGAQPAAAAPGPTVGPGGRRQAMERVTTKER